MLCILIARFADLRVYVLRDADGTHYLLNQDGKMSVSPWQNEADIREGLAYLCWNVQTVPAELADHTLLIGNGNIHR